MSPTETGPNNGGGVPAEPAGGVAATSARRMLGTGGTWRAPLILATLFIAVMSLVYFGSVINPTGHLHGLPVMVVNEDTGATAGGRHVAAGFGRRPIGLRLSGAMISAL